MITAIDTTVLLDVFGADPSFGERSREAVRACLSEGALRRLRVDLSPVDAPTALAAGAAFGEYHRAGGSRERVVGGFMVGAHAQAHADRLLTRDRGFYRRFFPGLTIVDPAA